MFDAARKFPVFDPMLYLSSPTMHGEELEYMTKAYTENWMTTIGENIEAVEEIACEQTGSGYAVALSSGTAALHLALKLAGVQPNDAVLCSDLTFSATVNPVRYENANPILIDAEYDTWNLDPAALEQAFLHDPHARAVVVTHLYGTPCRMEEINELAARFGAVVIEDAAESLGARYRGAWTGTFGQYNAISFNGNKIITGSTGGMLLTDDPAAAKQAKKWSTQAREDALWYQHEQIGYNYRMSNVIAGVVRGQFPYLEKHIAQKRAIYERYQKAFSDLPVCMNPFDVENSEPNFWLSCLLIDPQAMCRQERGERDARYVPEKGKSCPTEILDVLARHGAQGRPLWKPMHLQPFYRMQPFFTREGEVRGKEGACGADGRPLDVGGDLFARGLCLPSDNKMTPGQQDIVIELVKGCFS